MRRSTTSRRRAAYTLVELLLASTLLAIVLAGAQSVILLAAKALPDAKNELSQRVAASSAVDLLSGLLSDATAFTITSATVVEFTVPDRTGDGSPDTVRVQWSGTPGQPLTLSLNGGAATSILENVQQFALAYDAPASAAPETTAVGAEVLLCANEAIADLRDYAVDANHWPGQYLRPNLPATARSWSISRVKFLMRSKGTAVGQTRVQVRTALGALPQSTVLDEATVLESSLGTAYSWREVTFANAIGLTPGSAACVVLQWASDADAGEVQYQDNNAAVANSNFVETGNGGDSFSATADRSMQVYIWGRIVSADATKTQQLLRTVRCALRAGNAARVDAVIVVRNQPPVTLN